MAKPYVMPQIPVQFFSGLKTKWRTDGPKIYFALSGQRMDDTMGSHWLFILFFSFVHNVANTERYYHTRGCIKSEF